MPEQSEKVTTLRETGSTCCRMSAHIKWVSGYKIVASICGSSEVRQIQHATFTTSFGFSGLGHFDAQMRGFYGLWIDFDWKIDEELASEELSAFVRATLRFINIAAALIILESVLFTAARITLLIGLHHLSDTRKKNYELPLLAFRHLITCE